MKNNTVMGNIFEIQNRSSITFFLATTSIQTFVKARLQNGVFSLIYELYQ